jgi:SAM-dependent methyltransferase
MVRVVADVYAAITDADPTLVAQIAEVLELRAADPQQQAMRQAYLGDITFPHGARVLEVGCGTGAVTRELAAWPGVAKVTGVDPSPTFLAAAQRLDPPANARFLEGDARALDLQDHSVDVVVFHTTLCHVPGPHLALAEAARGRAPRRLACCIRRRLRHHHRGAAPKRPAAGLCGSLRGVQRARPVAGATVARAAGAGGLRAGRMRSYGYVETRDARYTPTIVDRGADALVAAGRIGEDAAAALKAEARRRITTGQFFGHIAYASLVARLPN